VVTVKCVSVFGARQSKDGCLLVNEVVCPVRAGSRYFSNKVTPPAGKPMRWLNSWRGEKFREEVLRPGSGWLALIEIDGAFLLAFLRRVVARDDRGANKLATRPPVN